MTAPDSDSTKTVKQSALVVKVEPKLDHAWIRCSGRNGAERATTQDPIRLAERRGVGQIENFGAELQIRLLPQSRVFDECDVGIPVVGTAHGIAGCVTKRKLRRDLKCSGVEPFRPGCAGLKADLATPRRSAAAHRIRRKH